MGPIQGYAAHELLWTPSRTARRTYELGAGDQVLAVLVQPIWWRESRIGAAADGTWTFARVGVFRPRVVITDAGSGAEIASMARSGWTGSGALTLPDGRHYQWRSGSVWGSKWAWLDAAGQPLMRFNQFGVLNTQCTVAIEPPATMDPHLTLLAMLGWYLMLLTRDDDAATAAAVATGA